MLPRGKQVEREKRKREGAPAAVTLLHLSLHFFPGRFESWVRSSSSSRSPSLFGRPGDSFSTRCLEACTAVARVWIAACGGVCTALGLKICWGGACCLLAQIDRSPSSRIDQVRMRHSYHGRNPYPYERRINNTLGTLNSRQARKGSSHDAHPARSDCVVSVCDGVRDDK